ncbi:hypothetical protein PSTG_16232 [Puccinia striiformis f. sp. tritici PST-78]|uniref:Uncharacterized protein n=1 Tax=Puccinia striiformis f. sp. tritici PST-78 TaxID=1165861 RepID=A0A0L0UU93_9BASI|nr:hypothetical protein PSTG_16232 [Puccinia striiformis f. sp. tritici PST-78]
MGNLNPTGLGGKLWQDPEPTRNPPQPKYNCGFGHKYWTNPNLFIKPRTSNEQAPACHSGDDVSQNSIDQRSNSDLALPSELSLDHQQSRSSNNNHLSSKDKDFKSSQFNKTIKSNLLDRITSTSQDLNRSV